MKMKVLSPAGDFESLKTAICNGADEVYLGVKDFNARNIEGFNLETLKTAVQFAHLYSVKVFLTVNILFRDDELQSVVDLIVDANNIGVDAFIIQDIGLATIVHQNYPNIEMHASTQMGIHNLEGAQEVAKLGFKRVVLSRETPLDEIKRIKQNTNLEVEYFVQGALCVSFSGNCYMSSYLFDCSGNRGKCKQLCRLPYDLRLDNKMLKHGYLLSAKDFNMIDRLKDLKDAGVDSLKIEGRARRPYYVAVATKMYRDAVDELQPNKDEISLAFNRGYVEGYFNGNSNIISNVQNHIGVEIGKVTKFKKGNKFNEIYFSSNREVSPKSTLKFFRDKEEIATISAYDLKTAFGGYVVTTKSSAEKDDKVNLILDYDREQEVLSIARKVPISITITAKANEQIKAEFEIEKKKFVVTGETPEQAKSAPLTADEIEKNFLKTEYFAPKLTIFMDDCFIIKKLLNDFRRNVYEKVFEVLTKNKNQQLQKIEIYTTQKVYELKDFQFVENVQDERYAKIIIFNPEIYDEKEIVEYKNLVENEKKIFLLNLPNFALKVDIEFLKNIVEKNKISILVNNLYAMSFDTKKYIGAGMNVYNAVTANHFALPYLTAEKGEHNMPYMTLRHCPMKEHLKADCAHCPFKAGYEYVLDSGKRFKLKRKKLSTCTFYLTD